MQGRSSRGKWLLKENIDLACVPETRLDENDVVCLLHCHTAPATLGSNCGVGPGVLMPFLVKWEVTEGDTSAACPVSSVISGLSWK